MSDQPQTPTPRTDAARTEYSDGKISAHNILKRMEVIERELTEANEIINLQHNLMVTAEKRGVDKAQQEISEAKREIERLKQKYEKTELKWIEPTWGHHEGCPALKGEPVCTCGSGRSGDL